MFLLIGLIYMFAVTCCKLISVDTVTTYSRAQICDRTIILGSNLFSILIDFSLPVRYSLSSTDFSCSFRMETSPGSLIAIKFLSPTNNINEIIHRCKSSITITSTKLNVKYCYSFPEAVISSYDYVNVTYESMQVHAPYQTQRPLKLLIFTYSYPDRFGICPNNQTICAGSRRCIHESLNCPHIFDFCDEYLRHCQNDTGIKRSKIRKTSFSGVYIFLSCLIFLLGITFYMCFCQGVHLTECLFHCCSVLEKTGGERLRRNDIDNDLTRPANGNEDDNTIITHYSDHVIDNENDRSDDNTNDNVSSIDSSEVATFGLPPSYSCIVISDARDCINSGDIQACDNISERNGVGVSKVCTDLPPSYSTVLGHEEEYNVHEIQ